MTCGSVSGSRTSSAESLRSQVVYSDTYSQGSPLRNARRHVYFPAGEESGFSDASLQALSPGRHGRQPPAQSDHDDGSGSATLWRTCLWFNKTRFTIDCCGRKAVHSRRGHISLCLSGAGGPWGLLVRPAQQSGRVGSAVIDLGLLIMCERVYR